MKKRRTLVIGDIHGYYIEMVQALKRAVFNPRRDLLICLGDVADGGSMTPEVVQYFIDLGDSAINIKGNHDFWTEEYLRIGIAKQNWLEQGGFATKDAYERKVGQSDFDMESHREFFKNQQLYYIDDQNRAFVHAGYTSKEGLGHEESSHKYYWDRDLFKIAMSSAGSQIPNILKAHNEIFIGHTSTSNWKYSRRFLPPRDCKIGDPISTPMNIHNLWNLDTGGGWRGRITVMDVDNKEYWQSDFVNKSR